MAGMKKGSSSGIPEVGLRQASRKQENDFISIGENGSSLEKQVYAFDLLAQLMDIDPTNESAPLVLHSDKIQGEANIGKFTNGIEILGAFLAARKKSKLANGELNSGAKVVFWDLTVILKDNPYVETALGSAAAGTNIGLTFIASLRNAGAPNEPSFELKCTNTRISAIEQGQDATFLSLAFDSMEIRFLPDGPNGVATGQVVGGWDLTKNILPAAKT
ncbi:MAG: hypothetical protein HOI80_01020 [Alphaproteobacteria bacterium]|jgi:hypothetical protein|nr:hypothetical protein [Alphaproteobacteria bacterium]MBT5390659.1 hypothetical protein [Alphaproteobacteria bacterium]MBT5540976.1 hypothetical protein [Alphaproteobacteria bacterium]MBT5654069.1 hypothetical protein [Alphaproteobacteria bacterium]